MTHLKLIEEDAATGEVAKIYNEIKQEMGIPFVPNFFKIIANSPYALAGMWSSIHNIMIKGQLPRSLKQMMFLSISVARNCMYCNATYMTFCKMSGVDEQTIIALVENIDNVQPQRTQDIVKFAVKCASEPLNLTTADYQKVRQHGVSSEEIAEIIAVAAHSVNCTIIAESMKIEIDEAIIQG